MGLWLSRLVGLFGEKEARILVLGLDNAGKTTILCKTDDRAIELADKLFSCFASVLSWCFWCCFCWGLRFTKDISAD